MKVSLLIHMITVMCVMIIHCIKSFSFTPQQQRRVFSKPSKLFMRSLLPEEKKLQAYTEALKSEVKMPAVILVNPFLDANVGSVSRAMLNFGMTDLRIVNPECDILSETARTLAVGSVPLLENAKVFNSLEDCIADLDYVVATTARKRNINQVLQTAESAAVDMIPVPPEVRTASDSNVQGTDTQQEQGVGEENAEEVTVQAAGIMFGRERNGLTNEEIALADARVAIPTFEYYEVLNMAQAVNILAYECFKRRNYVLHQLSRHRRNQNDEETLRWGSGTGNVTRRNSPSMSDTNSIKSKKDRFASKQEFEFFFDRWTRIIGTLDAVDNQISNATTTTVDEMETIKDANAFTPKALANMKTIFQRAKMTKGEILLMHGVLSEIESRK